jgi:hypothetical protein
LVLVLVAVVVHLHLCLLVHLVEQKPPLAIMFIMI